MVAWCRRRRAGNAGIVRALFNRQGVAIAGRDGTLVQSGGTGSTALHPTYGSVQSSGALISHSLAIPGVSTLPMSFSQGARTNLCPALTDGAGLSANSAANLVRTIVEDSATSSHYASRNTITLATSTTYLLRFSVRRVSGSRHAVVYIVKTGAAGIAINLDTGVVTNYVSGGGAVANAVATLVGDWWVCSCDVSSSAGWAASSTLLCALSSNGTTANSYAGDGASSLEFRAVTLEAATFSGLGLAEGATRAADNILWTPPSALSTTSGEVVAIAAPYLWSAGAGVAHPSGSTAMFIDAPTMYMQRTGTQDQSGKSDVGSQATSNANVALDTSVLSVRSLYWDATRMTFYRGSTLVSSDTTLSAPWQDTPSLRVGSTSTPALFFFGFVGLIYVPGGLTDAERIALARLTAGSLSYVG